MERELRPTLPPRGWTPGPLTPWSAPVLRVSGRRDLSLLSLLKQLQYGEHLVGPPDFLGSWPSLATPASLVLGRVTYQVVQKEGGHFLREISGQVEALGTMGTQEALCL